MRTLAVFLVVAAGCQESGSGGDDDGNETTLVGECDPAPDSIPIASQTVELFDQGCLEGSFTNLDVVEDLDGWNAALGSCELSVPAGIDFATQRVALVHLRCTPVDFRFSAERASEVVVGVMAGVSGACISDLLVVPLPKSAKPVRVAECRVDCPDCPPVP